MSVGLAVFAVLTIVTDRQTNRQTTLLSVTTGRIYIHSTVMQPNNTTMRGHRESRHTWWKSGRSSATNL